jgi:hypothetical protein
MVIPDLIPIIFCLHDLCTGSRSTLDKMSNNLNEVPLHDTLDSPIASARRCFIYKTFSQGHGQPEKDASEIHNLLRYFLQRTLTQYCIFNVKKYIFYSQGHGQPGQDTL